MQANRRAQERERAPPVRGLDAGLMRCIIWVSFCCRPSTPPLCSDVDVEQRCEALQVEFKRQYQSSARLSRKDNEDKTVPIWGHRPHGSQFGRLRSFAAASMEDAGAPQLGLRLDSA